MVLWLTVSFGGAYSLGGVTRSVVEHVRILDKIILNRDLKFILEF